MQNVGEICLPEIARTCAARAQHIHGHWPNVPHARRRKNVPDTTLAKLPCSGFERAHRIRSRAKHSWLCSLPVVQTQLQLAGWVRTLTIVLERRNP